MRKRTKYLQKYCWSQESANCKSKQQIFHCQDGCHIPVRMTKIKKLKQQHMLARMRSLQNTSSLLGGSANFTSTLDSNLVVSPKIGNNATPGLSYTTLRHINKRCSIISQGYLLNYVHRSIICNSKKLEKSKTKQNQQPLNS